MVEIEDSNDAARLGQALKDAAEKFIAGGSIRLREDVDFRKMN